MKRLAVPRVSLTTNAVSLMAGTILTNAFGLAFWAAAARLREPAVVGRAAATVAALALLATLGQLNLNNVIVRLLPGAGRLGRLLIARSYLATVVAAILIATAYGLSGLGSRELSGHWDALLLFVLAVPVLAIFTLQDSVLTALRLTRWVPLENVASAAIKLALLPALVLLPMGGGIAIAWVLPTALAVVIVNWLLFTRAIPRLATLEGTLPGRRRLLSFVGGEYASSIAATATAQLMPLVVIWRLGPTAAAYFTVPWLISMGIVLVLWNVASALVVEATGGHGEFDALLRRSVTLWAGVSLSALVVCVAGAAPLLSLAGARYAGHGVELLRLIGLSAPLSAITAVYWTLVWLDRRVWALAAFQACSGLILLGASVALMPHLGVAGVGWANLGVQGAAALAAGVLMIGRVRDGRLSLGELGRGRSERLRRDGERGRHGVGVGFGGGRRTAWTAWTGARVTARMRGPRTVLTAYLGLVAGCLSVVLILAAAPAWLTLTGVLMLACVPSGAAVMCWVDSGDAVAQAGLTLVLSLTLLALASAAMIWLGTWHPHALLALAGASIVSCGARVRRDVIRVG